MSYDNPRLIVDRKQNLSELCSNVCQGHDRFKNELIRAQENDIKLIILVEHGKGIKSLEDVIWWENPRSIVRSYDPVQRRFVEKETKAMQGETLYKVLCTLRRKYGCEFLFCDKKDTGSRIIQILGGD